MSRGTLLRINGTSHKNKENTMSDSSLYGEKKILLFYSSEGDFDFINSEKNETYNMCDKLQQLYICSLLTMLTLFLQFLCFFPNTCVIFVVINYAYFSQYLCIFHNTVHFMKKSFTNEAFVTNCPTQKY